MVAVGCGCRKLGNMGEEWMGGRVYVADVVLLRIGIREWVSRSNNRGFVHFYRHNHNLYTESHLLFVINQSRLLGIES